MRAAEAAAKAQKKAEEKAARAEEKAAELAAKEQAKAEKAAAKEELAAKKEAARVEKERQAKEKEEKAKLPKKPRTSYLYYCEETRAALKEQHPDMGVTDLAKLQGEGWKGLTDEQKKKFVEAAAADVERYQSEMTSLGLPFSPEPGAKRKKEGGGAKEGGSAEGGSKGKRKKKSDGGVMEERPIRWCASDHGTPHSTNGTLKLTRYMMTWQVCARWLRGAGGGAERGGAGV